MPRPVACVVLALTLAVLAACAAHYGSGGGHLVLRPGRSYASPGPSGDPWGPYIREAAQRFDVPQRWVRAVIQQESAGEVQALSPAGAMGLMQLMPGTYEMLREEYGLGSDPFEPHDNIAAGTAYIRQMYERYGAPGFLAAYNAGPLRVDDYLTNGDPLPSETVSYLSHVAPELGNARQMTGPLSVYAGANTGYAGAAGGCNVNAAYDPAHPCSGQAVPQTPVTLAAASSRGYCDPDAAYDPDRACVPAPQPVSRPASVVVASNAPSNAPSGACDQDAAYDPDQPCAPASPPIASIPPGQVASNAPSGGCDPDAAFDPGRPCAPMSAPPPRPVGPPSSYATASLLYQPGVVHHEPAGSAVERPPAVGSGPVERVSAAPRFAASGFAPNGFASSGFAPSGPTDAWAIQIGAFMTPAAAHAAATNVRRALPALLTPAQVEVSKTEPFGSQVLFRARLTNLSADTAADACSRLVQVRMPCLIVRPT